MTTIGAHRVYDLSDLSAGIKRTDERDERIDRAIGAVVLFLSGATFGFMATLAGVVFTW